MVSWARRERSFTWSGARVADRYDVLSLIGRGGMGVVMKAHDMRLGRTVALKVLRPIMRVQRAMREQLDAEARAMARVRHPSVVTLYDVGTWEGAPYLVMEYVEGETLDERIAAAPSGLPLGEVMELAFAIGGGLGALHDADVIHGDLKPGNVLLGADGRVAITDMGLALLLDGPDTTQKRLWCTPHYAAPELAAGRALARELRPRADVYSFGMTVYEMLTGRLPFEGPSEIVLARQMCDEPPPPSVLRSDLPTEVDRVVLRALRKGPEERTATPALLASELRRALSAAGIDRRRGAAARTGSALLESGTHPLER
jgi:serine/threonine-protein kinase